MSPDEKDEWELWAPLLIVPESQQAQEAEGLEATHSEGPDMDTMETETQDSGQTAEDAEVAAFCRRPKKGKMKTVYFSDQDEEAIVEFLKEHECLYNKRHPLYKDTQTKDMLWGDFCETRNLDPEEVKKWVQSQRTIYGKLTQTKSGLPPHRLTERQRWVTTTFDFLKTHIVRHMTKKGRFPKPGAYTTSPTQGSQSEAEGQDVSRAHHDLDTTTRMSTPVRPSSKTASVRSPPQSKDNLTLEMREYFERIETSIQSFMKESVSAKVDSPKSAFMNWLTLELDGIDDDDFSTFKTEAFNLVQQLQQSSRQRSQKPKPSTSSQPQPSTSSQPQPSTSNQPQHTQLSMPYMMGPPTFFPQQHQPGMYMYQPQQQVPQKPKRLQTSKTPSQESEEQQHSQQSQQSQAPVIVCQVPPHPAANFQAMPPSPNMPPGTAIYFPSPQMSGQPFQPYLQPPTFEDPRKKSSASSLIHSPGLETHSASYSKLDKVNPFTPATPPSTSPQAEDSQEQEPEK